jgi:hypothetical protein
VPKRNHQTPPAKLYSYADIAKETGIAAAILRVWYQRGIIPREDYRVGQSPAWTPATIRPFIEKHRRDPQ